jgi:DNA polymerase-3 subunit delta'
MYNPLDEIIGQSTVKDFLNKVVESRKIPHAFVFIGQDGVGKEFTAIQFAKLLALNSNVPNKNLIINSIQKLNEPYIKYIFPLPRGKNEKDSDAPYDKLKSEDIILIQNELDKKSQNPYYQIEIPNANNIKINSIRDINNFISIAYEETFHRIILISNSHLMSDAAQNALLKSLEEPSTNIIFILITSVPELLRETILSRCWKVNFENLSSEEIENILVKFFNVQNDIAKNISKISFGSVRTALFYLKYDLDFLTNKVIKILRYSFGKKYYSALNEIDEIVTDKILFKSIISLITLWLSYYNKFKLNQFEIPLNQFSDAIKKFTSKYPDIDVSKIISSLDDFSYRLDKNINPNIIASNLVVKLSMII